MGTRFFRPSAARRLATAMGALLASVSALPAQGWLVLPFANRSGETSLDWLGDGFAISLEEILSASGQTILTHDKAREVVSQWRVPQRHSVTLASALKAADHTSAARVVIGSFVLRDGELRVQGKVLNAEEPAVLGEVEESARLGDLFELQRRLGRALLRAGQEGLSSSQSVRDSSPAPPLTAYEQYVRALIQARPEERLQALRQAAHSFPAYPVLHYRLAAELHEAGKDDDALQSLERLSEVRFALSPEARLLRAEILLERGDAAAAEVAATAALDLRDTYRARLLRAEALLARGQSEPARADLEKARQLGAPAEDADALSRRLPAAAPASP